MSKGMNRDPYKQRYRVFELSGTEFNIPTEIALDNEYLTKMLKDFLVPPNARCLIESLPGEQHDEMNHCHKTGEKFITHIMTNGKVLSCTVQPLQIATNTKDGGRGRPGYSLPWEIERLSPNEVSPMQSGHGCTVQLACRFHDDRVFALVDAPETFDPSNIEHQFLLGLRALAGTVARLAGIMNWADIYHKERHIWSDLSKFIDLSEMELTEELDKWNGIRASNSLSNIVGCFETVSMPIGLAVSDIIKTDWGIVMVNIVPKDRRTCHVILTARKRRWPTRQRQNLQNMLERLTYQVSHAPADAIISLSTQTATGYVFFCPGDYRNGRAISNDQKRAVEQAVIDCIKMHPVIRKLKHITDASESPSQTGAPPMELA